MNLNQACRNIIENLSPEQLLYSYFIRNRDQHSYRDLLDYLHEFNFSVSFYKEIYNQIIKEFAEGKLFQLCSGGLSRTRFRK